MVRSTTFQEALDAAPDAMERSRLVLEAVATALRQINAELHWLDAQLYGRHNPAELRKLLEAIRKPGSQQSRSLASREGIRVTLPGDEDGYLLSGQAVRKTAKGIRRVLAAPVNPRPNGGRHHGFSGIAWHSFINESEETIPSHAIMRVDDVPRIVKIGEDDEIVQAVYKCNKPSTAFTRRYAINSALPVEAGDSGLCCFEGPVLIAHDSGWAPALGDGGGPKPGSWLLWKDQPATTCVDGPYDADNDVLLGSFGLITELLGKADSAINKAASGTVSIWAGTPGSESDTTVNITSVYNRFDNVSSGKWVGVSFKNGQPYLTEKEC